MMELQRSAKHRSLGTPIEPKPRPAKIKRPSLGERHRSAPLITRTGQNHAYLTTNISDSREIVVESASGQAPADNDDFADKSDITLVVLGNSRVGKTALIRHAFDLGKAISTESVTRSLSFEDRRYRVRLCEMELDDLEISDRQRLEWPKTAGDIVLPSVDGVLCLYDVTNEDSIIGVPQSLYAISKKNVPVVLVACKVDEPISEQEVGITFIERIRRSFPLVYFEESSLRSIRSAKKCLITAIEAAITASKLSEMAELSSDDEKQSGRKMTRLVVAEAERSQSVPIESSVSTPESITAQQGVEPLNRSSEPAVIEPSGLFHHHVTVEGDSSEAKNQGKPDGFTRRTSDTIESHVGRMSLRGDRAEDADSGFTFSELVNRLLRHTSNKSEAKFVPSFLCLYRSFATPKRLLVAIIDRFNMMDHSEEAPLTKVGELLRYLQVVSQWTGRYPAEFAEPSTRRLATSFIQDLEQTKHFAPAAKEITANLLTIIMDDDHDWAFENGEDHDDLVPKKSIASAFTLCKKDSSQNVDSDYSDDDRDFRRRSIRNSGTGSTTSSIVRSSVTSSQSATNLFNLENAREQSRLLKTIPHIPLTKVQWHHFMSTSTEELAREITRMDWTMYSGIRARDFVRHVSLSSRKRARSRHSDTIGMMVKHFNHLALFVSGMILFRDKPKHRARTLEKFMELAWKVRHLNNYNSLGAIVAGITGPEIARLTQTYDLISGDTKKQFLRLTVLMSTSRSHAAYRMAWDNSFNEKIPFIPLIRQDLTMAATANPTFVGERINWKKFEIMGDVIVGIQQRHEHPYCFPERTQRSQDITRLILETKTIEELEDSVDPRSELYERSMEVEPHPSSEGRRSVVNFGVKKTMTGWFQNDTKPFRMETFDE